jgi:hypothetical protein
MYSYRCDGMHVHRAVVVSSSVEEVRVKIPSALGAEYSLPLSTLTSPTGNWVMPSVGAQLLIALENSADVKVHHIATVTPVEIPIGSVIDYTGETAPNNWVLIEGQLIEDAETLYPQLWAVSPASWKTGSDLQLPSNSSPTLGLSKILRAT